MVLKIILILIGLLVLSDLSFANCRRKFVRQTISYKNCRPKSVLSYVCNGTCTSYARPSSGLPHQFERQCCQESAKRFFKVRLMCPHMKSGSFRVSVVDIAVPFECSCKSCSVTQREEKPALPDPVLEKRNVKIKDFATV